MFTIKMFTIKELAYKTKVQPYELAAWLDIPDTWDNDTVVSELDASEWIYCCIDTARGEGDTDLAAELAKLLK